MSESGSGPARKRRRCGQRGGRELPLLLIDAVQRRRSARREHQQPKHDREQPEADSSWQKTQDRPGPRPRGGGQRRHLTLSRALARAGSGHFRRGDDDHRPVGVLDHPCETLPNSSDFTPPTPQPMRIAVASSASASPSIASAIVVRRSTAAARRRSPTRSPAGHPPQPGLGAQPAGLVAPWMSSTPRQVPAPPCRTGSRW